MEKISKNIESIGEEQQPEHNQHGDGNFFLLQARINVKYCTEEPGDESQKQVPDQKKKMKGLRIIKSEDGERETPDTENSQEQGFI
jgi:hypothetical protein